MNCEEAKATSDGRVWIVFNEAWALGYRIILESFTSNLSQIKVKNAVTADEVAKMCVHRSESDACDVDSDPSGISYSEEFD